MPLVPPAPYLSLIIPAYNEEQRLPASLGSVFEFVSQQDFTWEVVVVENGSSDSTLRIAREFADKHPGFHVLQANGRGKGLAVRQGMLFAQGEWRMMLDADLSMPVNEIPRFIPPAIQNSEVIIASREAPGAVRYNEPEVRHIGGRVINAMIRLLALPGLHDTQCGFKCFSARAVQELFTHQTIDGWSFDVEILYLARKRGYKITELPIPWYYSDQSHVRPVADTLAMLADILRIRSNDLLGHYA
ncbi:MAG: glycosyltransferase family 2 protein [Anaerolineales bacterium]|nr:MAG: glycosyltransferase family 2 protein [Anaerolineales bacterium]